MASHVYQIDPNLVIALVPIGFIMIVSLMTWVVRELSRLSRVVYAQGEAQAEMKGELSTHVADDTVVAAAVHRIEGRLGGTPSGA